MRILMIADYIPYPQISGGRIRIYNLLRRVAMHHEVSLAAFLEKPEDIEGVKHLREFCENVVIADYQERSRLGKIIGMLKYVLDSKPPELLLLYSDELVEKILQLFSKIEFDVVQIESVMGLYLEKLPLHGSYKKIQMFQNFTSQQYGRVAQVEQRWDRKVRTWINSTTMGYWEPRYAENFDRITTVSEDDRLLLIKANPRLNVQVIPNGVDIEKYKPLSAQTEKIAPNLMFIGNMGYPPCVDAVLYFCAEILPLIRQRINGVELWIVGRDPREEVLKLNGNGVHVTGRVEDILPYYQQNSVCVVPLRAGGGTRLKILEAMALGRPVVSTTIGCEGLDVIDGEHLMIADTPEQFAIKTARLLNDRQLYRYIVDNGRQLVESKYGWDKIAVRLMGIYEEMVATPKNQYSVEGR